jgi:hypothetical protein
MYLITYRARPHNYADEKLKKSPNNEAIRPEADLAILITIQG